MISVLSRRWIVAWAVFLGTTAAAGPAPEADPVLPKVLIIGDSISMGYTPRLQSLLSGLADVRHNPGNGQSTWTGLEKIEEWLGETRWDLIHFNWGLHDLCYRHPEAKVYGNRDKIRGTLTSSRRQYAENLEKLVLRLKKTGARLIWATTTPVPDGEAGRFKGDAWRYNRVASDIMRRHDIGINDLYAEVYPRLESLMVHPGDVHLTEEGYTFLAERISAVILSELNLK